MNFFCDGGRQICAGVPNSRRKLLAESTHKMVVLANLCRYQSDNSFCVAFKQAPACRPNNSAIRERDDWMVRLRKLRKKRMEFSPREMSTTKARVLARIDAAKIYSAPGLVNEQK